MADLVTVEGGAVMLGISRVARDAMAVDAPDFDFDDEVPERPVELKSFQLARTPVTHAEFLRFVDAGGYREERFWAPDAPVLQAFGSRDDFVDATGRPGPLSWAEGRPPPGCGDHPVHGVSWFEARAYCRFLHKRLPSDAEWERAARGPAGRRYPWGEDFDADRCVALRETTAPVSSCLAGATPEGILHLAGNVAEWVDDGPPDERFGLQLFRYVRNDCWAGTAMSVRGTVRTPYSPMTRRPGFGFRVADSVLDLKLSKPMRV